MTSHGDVFVPGTPAPQGSTKAYVVNGRAHITADNERTQPWRAVVAAMVRTLVGPSVAYPTEPLVLRADFVMPRRAADMTVRVHEWTPEHVVKPDLDKLVRAVGDALTGILYRDDAQIVSLNASKRFAGLGGDGVLEQPGVHLAWLALREVPRPAAQRRAGRVSGGSPV